MCMCMGMSMCTGSSNSGKGTHMMKGGFSSTGSVAVVVDGMVLSVDPRAARGLVGQSQGHAGHEKQRHLWEKGISGKVKIYGAGILTL